MLYPIKMLKPGLVDDNIGNHKSDSFFSDDWIMVINNTAAVYLVYPTQMVFCENWYTYSTP